MATQKEVRDAANDGCVLISQSSLARYLQHDLYTALSEFDGMRTLFDLIPEDRRKREEEYDSDIEKYISDFLKQMRSFFPLPFICRRSGAHLSAEKRSAYEGVMKKIIENENEFSKNLAEEKTELRFTREQLTGVCNNTLATLGRDGDLYIVTMKYPDVFPVLETCSVSETRRQVFTAFGKRGGQKNLDLLEDTLKLRKEAVSILGYLFHSHFTLDTRISLLMPLRTRWHRHPKTFEISSSIFVANWKRAARRNFKCFLTSNMNVAKKVL